MRFQRFRKALNGRGMSLAESLLTVLIMSLVAMILAMGIPVARNAFERVVLAANAQVLLSTTVSTLRNELSAASEVTLHKRNAPVGSQNGSETEDGTSEAVTFGGVSTLEEEKITVVEYYSPSREAASKIFIADGKNDKITGRKEDGSEDILMPEGAIGFQRYASSSLSKGGDTTLLVSLEASTSDLYVSYESVAYDPDAGIISFKNISVNREHGAKNLAKTESYSIRVISRD